jgi:hypothetical protein
MLMHAKITLIIIATVAVVGLAITASAKQVFAPSMLNITDNSKKFQDLCVFQKPVQPAVASGVSQQSGKVLAGQEAQAGIMQHPPPP